MAICLSQDNILNMKLLLKQLPDKIAIDNRLWFDVGAALFNWGDGASAALELWKEFSNKRLKPKDCGEKWDAFKKQQVKNPKTVFSLISLHKKHSLMKWNGSYDSLHPFKSFDLLEGNTTPIVTFKSKFVSDATEIKLTPKSIILIIAPTGSGKTQFIKRNVMRNNDVGLISLISRRSLAPVHEEEFGLDNYLNVPKNCQFGVGMVSCIDSLMKYSEFASDPNEKYILILDEFNSLIMHLLNPLANMSTQRFNIIEILKQLCLGAEYVIGLDADISTGVIDFIKEITNLPTLLYKNEFKQERKAPVVFYKGRPQIRNSIIEKLLANEKVFVISDDKKTFLKTIVIPIWNRYPHLRDSMKIYTSQQGESQDLGVVNEIWIDKNVFASPKIVYGVDYNIPDTHHVYSISYGKKTLNALELNQQIARIRNPKSINVYCRNVCTQRFFTLKDVQQNNLLAVESFLGGNLIEPSHFKHLQSYRKLINWRDYLNDNLKSYLCFHVHNLLVAKGYENITYCTNTKKIKFPMVTKDEEELYRKTLLNLADNQYASYVLGVENFVKQCDKNGIFVGYDLMGKMKKDQTIDLTIRNYYASINARKKFKDTADGIIQSFDYKLQLAIKMNNALNLKWLDYDRSRDLKLIANQRPVMHCSDEFLGQICNAFPRYNQKNKFKDYHKFKKQVHYYNTLIDMTANLFPALFEPTELKYNDNDNKLCKFRTFNFNDQHNIRKIFDAIDIDSNDLKNNVRC